MKDDGFYKVLMRGHSAKKKGLCTICVKDVIEMFQKQVVFCKIKTLCSARSIKAHAEELFLQI